MNLQHERHRLQQLLHDGRWYHRRDLKVNMNDRTIRAVCQAYPTEFISTQKGYCLFEHASDDEISWAIAGLRSRARKISEHADCLERAILKREHWANQDIVAGRQGMLL